jgi:prolyl-tRNA synthetase
MRLSQLFFQTLRETPGEAQSASQQFLLRAGYIRLLATGIYSYLPLAKRSFIKLEKILRQEIEAIGGQEIEMPVVQPAELWMESKRWFLIDEELVKFQDRNQREMVLAMTHEEVAADLVRKLIHSYRQLPALVYQIQTKFRDDARPRGGLVRAREFTMKDSYSLDASWEGLEHQYRAHYQAYFNIFRRCGLDVMAVHSDPGMMGGKTAHEFIVRTPMGEDTILICAQCGYAANRQVATFTKAIPQAEPHLPIAKVATPECKTIEQVAAFLDVPSSKTAKAVFLVASIPSEGNIVEQFIFTVIRGDMEINETKLSNLLGAKQLRPAQEDEIRAVGAVPGYASPVFLDEIFTVVDDLIPNTPNLVAGANHEGFHLRNVNYRRDFTASLVGDIAAARAGDPCPRCQAPLLAERAVEVGHIFQLGTRYSETLGCLFQDENGQEKPVIMGSYGIGLGRLFATTAEIHHDEHGLVWPITLAPFDVHLVYIPQRDNAELQQTAEKVYKKLIKDGIEVLYDDREETAGVKFSDADLIGAPFRLTISTRSLKSGGAELKIRRNGDFRILPLDTLTQELRQILENEYARYNQNLPVETYPE